MLVNVDRLQIASLPIDEMVVSECLTRDVARRVVLRGMLVDLGLAPVLARRDGWWCGTLLPIGWKSRLRERADGIFEQYRRESTWKRKASETADVMLKRSAVPSVWAQRREMVEMSLLVLALDPAAPVVMDDRQASLWYNKRPLALGRSPLSRKLRRVILDQIAENASWAEFDDSANRLMNRGLAHSYEQAIAMAFGGFGDEDDLVD